MTISKRHPFLLFAGVLIAGIVTTDCWAGGVTVRAQCALLVFLLGALRPRVASVGLFVGCFLLGTATSSRAPNSDISIDSERFQATVLSRTSTRKAVLSIHATAAVHSEWRSESGRAWASFPEGAPAPHTSLVVRGRLEPIHDEGLPGAPGVLRAAKRWGAPNALWVQEWRAIGAPEPKLHPAFDSSRHGAILRALALGDRSGLTEAEWTLFRSTGTSHLLAVSGLHVGLVATMAASLVSLTLQRARRGWAVLPWRALPPLIGIVTASVYVHLAGWPVSGTRALVFFCLWGAAYSLDRRLDPWQVFGAAAFFLALKSPGVIFSPSFQLSFGAVAGMLVLAPHWKRWLPPDLSKPVRWVIGSLAITVSASWGTLPAAAWWFQAIAPAAPVANLIAVPLIGAIATPAAVLGALLPDAINWAPTAIADCAVQLALGSLRVMPHTVWTPAVGPTGALLLGLAVAVSNRSLRLGLAIASLVLLWRAPTPKTLEVHFLDVGQGDAALVEWPDGRRWLIDGGPPGTRLAEYLRRRRIGHLDAVILSHPHADHQAGLSDVLTTVQVEGLWLPSFPRQEQAAYAKWLQPALDLGVPIRLPGSPQMEAWSLDQHKETLSVNDESLVLQVRYGENNFLFCGDIEAQGEALLSPLLPTADVMKVPHHGSRTSSTDALLTAVDPQWAVFSAGRDNRFGHPHPEVWRRYRHATRLLTATDGEIHFSSNGTQLSLHRSTR